MASRAGVPVILDAGGLETPINAELLPHITVLSPNETELARLSGMPTDTVEQVVAAARQLQQQGVTTVLVKRGAEGSMLISAGTAHEATVWSKSKREQGRLSCTAVL